MLSEITENLSRNFRNMLLHYLRSQLRMRDLMKSNFQIFHYCNTIFFFSNFTVKIIHFSDNIKKIKTDKEYHKKFI